MEVICEVCNSILSKYKCPKCCISYCSLTCWKNHKATNCQQLIQSKSEEIRNESNTSEGKQQQNLFQTEDTVPTDKLLLLDGSKELQEVLHNPHVRDMLHAIDSSPNPAAAMQAAMLEPIFTEFADACLRIIEPVSNTHD